MFILPGRNDKGQLGLGNCERTDPPTVVDSLSEFNIVEAACGRNHTLFLTGKTQALMNIYVPHRRGGGHIIFGVDPVGVGVGIGVSVTLCLHDIS